MSLEHPRIAINSTLTDDQARFFTQVAERHSGIQIAADQIDFLSLRIRRRMRHHGDQSFETYINRIQADETEEKALMECLVTHTTGFFREPAHFHWLRETGLELLTNGVSGSPLNIWSAAASNGSELWSVAMETASFQQDNGRSYSAKLFGTDISKSILERARHGVYDENEIAGIPSRYKKLFLQRSVNPGTPIIQRYRIAAPILKSATFVDHNLLQPLQNPAERFDLAFLRNILIYFNKTDQKTILSNVISKLKCGGILMIGHTEALSVDTDGLTRLATAIYRKD